MAVKPGIHVIASRLDKYVDAGSLVVLFIMWGVTFFFFSDMPGQIPTHYNAKGQVDATGNKFYAFLLPVIGTIVYCGLTLINWYPHLQNHPTQIQITNTRKFYRSSSRLLRTMKFVIMLVLCLIVFANNYVAFTISDGPGVWFLPVLIALLIFPNLIYLVKIFQSDKN